jgi:molybdate transport system substrate-binding protein
MLKIARTFLILLLCLASRARADDQLTVSVAASFRDVIQTIADEWKHDHPKVTVSFNFGGSGALARQIEDGAPVDVFLSAGRPEIDRLTAKDLVAGTPVVVAGNRLVVVVPAASSWIGKTPHDLLSSPDLKRIALGDPASVPFGAYAKQALTTAGLWDSLSSKAVYAADVRQALTYADDGSVDAAVVYATDARVAKTAKLLGEVPGSADLKIEALAVRLKRSTVAAAESFLTFLTDPKARRALAAAGFVAPGP